MKSDSLFPEVPKTVQPLTQPEKDEIAVKLIEIWLDPPEVTSHWEKDGELVREGTKDAVEKKTKTAHLSRGWRVRQAINRSNMTNERKAEIGQIKYTLYSVDEELFHDRDSVMKQIEEAMSGATPPETKAALDAAITAKWVPVPTFTQKYMDAHVGKAGATFVEFCSARAACTQ